MNIRINLTTIARITASCALASLLLASCTTSNPTTVVSKAQPTAGKGLVGDTLTSLTQSTTLTSAASGIKTYYFTSNVVIPAGDTLLIQSGVNLIAVWDSSGVNNASPELDVNGTLISLGTQSAPNYIGPASAAPTTLGGTPPPDYGNLWTYRWGGIAAGPTSGDVNIKWTRLTDAGGDAGNSPIYASGKTRYTVYYQNPIGNCVLEDSWFRASYDDCVRTAGGQISFMRNTFEFDGSQGGEAMNIKGSTKGDIAYNLVIGNATNGPKLAYPTPAVYELNVNIYNNTVLNSGWRMIESGRAGSTDMETGARGTEYNNLIVNCKTGFQELPTADIPNIYYDGMEYYGQTDSIIKQFYPPTGVQTKQSHDVADSGVAGRLDPKFVNYNVTATTYDYSLANHQWPISFSNENNAINEVGSSNFRLAAGSPAIGKGVQTISAAATTGGVIIPLNAVTVPGTSPYAAKLQGLGKDIGCYQTDGTGNQH